MPQMFSLDEMRELALAFPDASSRAFPESDQEVRLVPSLSGDGFIRSDVLLQKLNEHIESDGHGRLPLSELATAFDISKEELSALVREPQAELLLSTDGQNVISKPEAERLQNDLKELVQGRVVYAAGVAIANNLALESIHKLIAMNRYGAKGEDEDGPRLALYPQTSDPREVRKSIIFSPPFLDGLVADAQAAAEAAQQSGVPESIPPDGVLPTAFLQLIVDRLGSDFRGRVAATEGTVEFIPISYLERLRDDKLDELVNGTTPFCSLQWFVDLMPEQYPDISSAERYVNSQHPRRIFIFFDTAVSKKWHDKAIGDLLHTLADKSIINISDPFQDLSPDAARSAAAKAHAEIIAIVRTDNECTVVSEGLFPYLIGMDLFLAIQDAFNARVRAHAEHLWSNSHQLPEAELTGGLGDLNTVLAPAAQELQLPPPLLPILVRCGCDGGAKAAFNETLTQLEAEADAALAAFWADRVAARFELHAVATTETAIADAKVRAQLLDLLRDYAAKELVPDAVARAEAKGLVRSARARRNVKKLLAVLKEPSSSAQIGEQGLAAVQASLQKFAAKMDVPPVADVQARKEAYVRDMVRDMQKDADAPRLFLKLMVALWAKRADGVVYATGKFAPKLLKLLSKGAGDGGLGEEQVARLEALKDAVKEGSAGDAEKAEMRKMAMEAWEV
ncbi:Purine biosynthesis protein purh [Lasiodiplodia theobromae]|uniref:Purine biosynthesis protein purh n=1 Tax=Lasiodiplodia theobromae TaxID=45133 RepID=UPI0015C3B10B|nr:Purine biosynthesis protein purh [Lasiodiplodia theobromae]KAF4541391.1 Purine biosynthesis protein purh [Lasiodiplodia theobromae]